jgi:hypothetical protein
MLAAALALALSLLTACGGSGHEDPLAGASVTPSQSIQVSSLAFSSGAAIPKEYTCDGFDASPALSWKGVPEGARSLAVIADDPDAGGFVHWVVYAIPPSFEGLPARVQPDAADFRQGKNSFGKAGYGGPCPPKGSQHTYRFRVYALDVEIFLKAGSDAKEVVEAMKGHILAFGELTGTYAR